MLRTKYMKFYKRSGYNVDSAVLDASEYGVPQKRLRAFFLATRQDIPQITFEKLVKQPKVLVKEAIEELYVLEKAQKGKQRIFYNQNRLVHIKIILEIQRTRL